jgi:hypothetical protein
MVNRRKSRGGSGVYDKGGFSIMGNYVKIGGISVMEVADSSGTSSNLLLCIRREPLSCHYNKRLPIADGGGAAPTRQRR